MLSNIAVIAKREFKSYFLSPIAYVFMVIFLVLAGYFPLMQDNFFEGNEASLNLFFGWHPLLFLVLVPAIGMHSWANERNVGTMELLFTMPISLSATIIGKFLAAWSFLTLTLLATFPIVITVGYLGNPDYGQIICGYIGSFLLAGTYLGVSTAISATTKDQVVTYIVSAVTCLLLMIVGMAGIAESLSTWAPNWLIEVITSFSTLTYFTNLQRGVIDLKDIVYYLSIIIFSQLVTWIILKNHRNI